MNIYIWRNSRDLLVALAIGIKDLDGEETGLFGDSECLARNDSRDVSSMAKQVCV